MQETLGCPGCGREIVYKRFHAGFGNQGFMYGATSPVVLTWASYDPGYQSIVRDKHPWMLSPEEQRHVEREVRSGLDGEPFRFANPPVCPGCGVPLPSLFDPSREYYVVVGESIDARTAKVWR